MQYLLSSCHSLFINYIIINRRKNVNNNDYNDGDNNYDRDEHYNDQNKVMIINNNISYRGKKKR